MDKSKEIYARLSEQPWPIERPSSVNLLYHYPSNHYIVVDGEDGGWLLTLGAYPLPPIHKSTTKH